LNGSNIATGPTFTPTQAGDYTCTVTATNQAGSTSQTSSVKQVKAK
jgi:PKD repeat protein